MTLNRNTTSTLINPYKRGSRSARALAKAVGGRVYRPGDEVRNGTTVINWGDGQCPLTPCLNHPAAIRLVSNKRTAFMEFAAKGVPVPRFATSRDDVNWKTTTVVRHKLTGHSGEGIEIVHSTTELPDAPLYVEYIKKQAEYRIHVGKRGDDTVVIVQQRKARRLDVPEDEVNWQVRNHSNGFVFVRQDVNPPTSVIDAAKQALIVSTLDFGAVDVIYNAKERRAYVLEINTAPGLEGQTIEDYATFFRSLGT